MTLSHLSYERQPLPIGGIAMGDKTCVSFHSGPRLILRYRTLDLYYLVYTGWVSMPPASGNPTWEQVFLSGEWLVNDSDYKSLWPVSAGLFPLGNELSCGNTDFGLD